MQKMTDQSTTPQQAEMIRQYFNRKIDSLKRSKIFYRDRLFKDADPEDLELYDKIMDENPESTIPLLMYQNLHEIYELLALLADSAIESEIKVKKLDDNLKILGNENHVDISSVTQDIGDLKNKILPAIKGLTEIVARDKEAQKRRKENGEDMIV